MLLVNWRTASSIHPDDIGSPTVDALPNMRRTYLTLVFGLLYAIATATCSVICLYIVAPSMTNDHMWPNFNTTGIQTFLGDLYNSKLALNTSGALDILSDSSIVTKWYGSPTTYIDMRPATARTILLDEIPLEEAIRIMRSIDLYENMRTVAPTCWLDFGRVFEMAHTARRQELCVERRQSNGAVYLESLLRNVQLSDLLSSTYYPAIQATIYDAVLQYSIGAEWVRRIEVHSMLSISEEVNFWLMHNITKFQNQLQNYYQEGFQDSIVIVNALGIHQSFLIANIRDVTRPKGAWSTQYATCGFWNDLDICMQTNTSLMRISNNSFQAAGFEWDTYYFGPSGTPATTLVRTQFGPLTSFDINLIPIPSHFIDCVIVFQQVLYAAVVQNPIPYTSLVETTLDPIPQGWRVPGAVYYGGNPICPCGVAVPFVQPSFGYYDDCGAQIQLEVTLWRDPLLFAIVASAAMNQTTSVQAICSLSSSHLYSACSQTITAAEKVVDELLYANTSLARQIRNAFDDILQLNLSFVQWATVNGMDQVLRQDILSLKKDPWILYGWIGLYQWANGEREVYSFESDFDTLNLLSRPHILQPLAAVSSELSNNASRYIWGACIYVSTVLCGVLAIVLVAILMNGSLVDGNNLFYLNRLVGSSWIGRPFLFLRGLTAIFVLSTSPVEMNTFNGITSFEFIERPLWSIMILAGEATWVSYVLVDIFIPLSQDFVRQYASIASLITWLTISIIDHVSPVRVEATIGRKCTVLSFTRGLQCVSGEVHIGSLKRVNILMLLVISIAVICFGIALLQRIRYGKKFSWTQMHHVLLPGASASLLARLDSSTELDVAACVLSGIVPLKQMMFDVKLWLIFDAKQTDDCRNSLNICVNPRTERIKVSDLNIQHHDRRTSSYSLRPATFMCTPLDDAEIQRRRSSIRAAVHPLSIVHLRSTGIFGLAYMCSAVVSSYLFLSVSSDNLANDFMWVDFTTSHLQSYLCNFYNSNLQFANPSIESTINNVKYSRFSTTMSGTQVNIVSSALYAISIQNEVNALSKVVAALRKMDGCQVPLIAVSYCYVDFNRTWGLAHSSARQQRCDKNFHNGALYLESVFRNMNWGDFMQCWGHAIEGALFASLKNSITGTQWLDSVIENALPVSDEVAYWKSRGIFAYTTYWQNFKRLGVTEIFFVSNAFGIDYPLTLKRTNSSLQYSAATSLRMYSWLAIDLVHFSLNMSSYAGKSIHNGDSNYIFSNSTPETALFESGALVSPLDPAFIVLSAKLGPLGLVDLVRVSPPLVLTNLYRSIKRFLVAKLASSKEVQTAFRLIYKLNFFTPQPEAWDGKPQWAGDFLCGLNYGGSSPMPFQFFSSNGLCGNYLTDYIAPYTQNLILALLVTKGQPFSLEKQERIASRDLVHKSAIIDALNRTLDFMQIFLNTQELNQFQEKSQLVRSYLHDKLTLELIQYLEGNETEPLILSRVLFFANNEPDLEFFSWLYLFEWIEGKREVVTFEGDLDSITTLSTVQNFDSQPPDRHEIPLNTATYLLRAIQYVTAVLLGVGCVVCMYIVSSRGYVEGLHMIPFNLIAGHVWIGRPFMLLRGLTAVAILSTASLHLKRPHDGLLSYLQAAPRPWLATLLSSSEISWLVYVIVDTFSLITWEFTVGYSTSSAIAVTIAAAVWSLASPTSHSFTILRSCEIEAVDFDVVCSSGIFSIGDSSRFNGLVSLAFGCTFGCYILERLRHKLPPPKLTTVSFFMYSAAKHEFEQALHIYWEHDGVFYLDKASAALTGILSLEMSSNLYIFDIKTWRIYILTEKHLKVRNKNLPKRLHFAIPLFE